MFASSGIVAFVSTTDLDAADAFYGGKLGMQRLDASPFSNVYDSDGTTLRITLVQELTPAPFTILGWNVADIGTVVDELAAAGIATERYDGFEQDDRDVWTAPSGAQIVWFRDPDGNMLSASQLP